MSDQEIETRWWNLMSIAHEKGLTVHLSKCESRYSGLDLIVKVVVGSECIYSGVDLEHRTEHFFKVERVINEFKKEVG